MTPVVFRAAHEPTHAQFKAGNYAKRKVAWHGMTISIENDVGSVRRGFKPDGTMWETRMIYPYGYINRTEGVDGDHVDVFLGPNPDALMVYVIHQRKVGDWKNYDEDKCMLNFSSEEDARAAFLSNYDDPRFLGPITAMPVAEFVEKAKATKEAPAMIKALLVKAHIKGYTKRDGTFVREHDDRRNESGSSSRSEYSKCADIIAEQAEGMGLTVKRDSSNVSDSEYLRISGDDGEDVKIRISNHSAKPTYEKMNGVANYELGPHDMASGSVDDWPKAVVWLALHFGRNPPDDIKNKADEIAADEKRRRDERSRAEKERTTAYLESQKKRAESKAEAMQNPDKAARIKELEDKLKDTSITGNKRKKIKDKLRAVIGGGDVTKAILFFKARVDPYIRRGRIVRGYDNGHLKKVGPDTKQMTLVFPKPGDVQTVPPTDAPPASAAKKFYVTMIRDPGPRQRVAWLAGPFDTHEEALARVDDARRAAQEVDPRAAFDAFGTVGRTAEKHPPGVLNAKLGIAGSSALS